MSERRGAFHRLGLGLSGPAIIVATAGLVAAVRGADPVTPGAKPAVTASPRRSIAQTERDIAALAARIDELVDQKAKEAQVEPAAVCDDAEFLRRAWIDIAGKIPPVTDVRDFLDDRDPGKRDRLVNRLLGSTSYVTHFTDQWRALLMPEASTSFELRYTVPMFEAWLRTKLAANASYAQMAREIVTIKMSKNFSGGFVGFNPGAEVTPSAYITAKGGKPENLGAAVARTFLGVRIECAQCHKHPFAKWTRDEFWSFAAFFGGIDKQAGDDNIFAAVREVVDRRELVIPGSERAVQPGFLGGGEPELKFNVTARETLADWLVSKQNPYFAKAGANRVWFWMFGAGLVDPVDDFSDQNPPTHPELLDELARAFADHDFDIKFLIRAIASSRAYQRSSVAATPSAGGDEIKLYTHHAVKGMTGEQLFDSLAQALGAPQESRLGQNPFVIANNPGSRSDFVEKFSKPDAKPTEQDTSILEALSLMNGVLVDGGVRLENAGTYSAIAESPFLDSAGKVEALYLATLSRKPKPEELERMVLYIERGGPSGHPKKALADVFWALLNSSEFMLNH